MSSALFIEVFCEELPVSMIEPALDALEKGVLALLDGIEHGDVRRWSTPRRLAMEVADVAEARVQTEVTVTGPPADRAFDANGNPTKAALGFARGKGADASDLHVVDGPKGQVVAVTVREGGERAIDRVQEGLEALVLGLPFKKSMRWGSASTRFGRPLHGVGALFGTTVLEGTIAGIAVANVSQGHRNHAQRGFSYHSADEWVENLRSRHVEADRDARRARVVELLSKAAADEGAEDRFDPELVDEVTDLVEWPTLVVGELEPELMELPPRLLVTSMKVHQRVFPLWMGDSLSNRFAVISNTPTADPAVVGEGNARVLRARFHDARFFFSSDQAKTLDQHGEGLARMAWIRGMGTMADKASRISDLSAALATVFGADEAIARRAGALCKSDLTTEMVYEFPELQGHMGRLYATHHGEDAAVAWAIEEHYQPVGGHDAPAPSAAGRAVACADRLDTLVGCFGVGMVPRGGGDPQGLRRAALGLVRTMVTAGVSVDLEAWLGQVWQAWTDAAVADETLGGWRDHLVYGKKPRSKERKGKEHEQAVIAAGDFSGRQDEVVGALRDFLLARFKAWAISEGASADQIDAVTFGALDPYRWHARLQAVRAVAGTADFPRVLSTCKRVLNITRGKNATPPEEDALGHDAERTLARAIASSTGAVRGAVDTLDYDGALAAALSLEAPVAAFFDAVLVEDPDPQVRAVRLGLLGQVGALFGEVADFSQISTR